MRGQCVLTRLSCHALKALACRGIALSSALLTNQKPSVTAAVPLLASILDTACQEKRKLCQENNSANAILLSNNRIIIIECPTISHEFSVFCKKYLQPWIRNPFNLGPSLGCCPGSGPSSRGHSHFASSLAGAGAPPVWHSQVAVVVSWECSVHHRQGEAPPRERRQINVGFSMRGETFNQSGLSMREIIIIIVIMMMMMIMQL